MPEYEVGAIFTRCFVQERLDIAPDTYVEPLSSTGFKGEIHNSRALLDRAGHHVTRDFVDRAIEHFKNAGQSVCVHFSRVDAPTHRAAMAAKEEESERIAGALAVLSVNPAILLAMFARGKDDPGGVEFKFQNDPIIRHGTNVHGYLDAIPDLCSLASSNPKIALLLSLYRASLRETDVDKKMLFQLILLEEASDDTSGSLGQRLAAFCDRYGVRGDLDAIAAEIGIALPAGRTIVDALVKLRNAAAHNGAITEAGLRDFGGEWVVPLLADKAKLHRLIVNAVRYVFAVLCGHSREETATKVGLKPGEPFAIKLD
jgi:hypothetical protein